MTIKVRNRITLIFFILSSFVISAEFIFLLFRFFTRTISYPTVIFNSLQHTSVLLRFSKNAVLASLIFSGLYVTITSISLVRFFLKTQAPDIIFFLIFLMAILCDSIRLTLPLYEHVNSYSNYIWLAGRLILFARILAPLGLTGCVALTSADDRQNIERNSLIIFIAAAFLAYFIPINTTSIRPNLVISYSFHRTINLASIFILLFCVITLLIQRHKQELKQTISIGFILICIGYYFLFEVFCYLYLALAISFITAGTIVYLKNMHDEYMWLN